MGKPSFPKRALMCIVTLFMFKVCSATQAKVKDERMFDVLQPEFCKVTAEF